jgi:hypothetical protein
MDSNISFLDFLLGIPMSYATICLIDLIVLGFQSEMYYRVIHVYNTITRDCSFC